MRWAGPYQGAVRCTAGPTPGARALLAWALEEYSDDGLRSGGIFNCRPVRGGKATSLHGEGRADDLMVPATPGKPTALGLDVLHRLGAVGDQLGIQCVIYARRIYSAPSPDGRPYEGKAPHWDHLHVELTHAAAGSLTLARCRVLLARPLRPHSSPGTSKEDDVQPPATISQHIVAEARKRDPNAFEFEVRYLRHLLHLHGHRIHQLDSPDWGDPLTDHVKDYQRHHGLKDDGVQGPASWGRMQRR